jgi:hypothetical protein
MYIRSGDPVRTVIKVIGGTGYGVGIGLIILRFASFFLAPYLSLVFGSVFVFIVLGFIATTLGRMLLGMAKTKSFSGPVSEQEPVSRSEVQEEMTYDSPLFPIERQESRRRRVRVILGVRSAHKRMTTRQASVPVAELSHWLQEM